MNYHTHMAIQRPTGMWLLSAILESRLEKQRPEMFHSLPHVSSEGQPTHWAGGEIHPSVVKLIYVNGMQKSAWLGHHFSSSPWTRGGPSLAKSSLPRTGCQDCTSEESAVVGGGKALLTV